MNLHIHSHSACGSKTSTIIKTLTVLFVNIGKMKENIFSLCILFRHNAAICYRVKTGFWDNSLYLTLFFFMLKFSISEYSEWSTYMYTFFCKAGWGAPDFFLLLCSLINRILHTFFFSCYILKTCCTSSTSKK